MKKIHYISKEFRIFVQFKTFISKDKQNELSITSNFRGRQDGSVNKGTCCTSLVT